MKKGQNLKGIYKLQKVCGSCRKFVEGSIKIILCIVKLTKIGWVTKSVASLVYMYVCMYVCMYVNPHQVFNHGHFKVLSLETATVLL